MAVSGSAWQREFTAVVHPALWRLLQTNSEEDKAALTDAVTSSLKALMGGRREEDEEERTASVAQEICVVAQHMCAPFWQHELAEMMGSGEATHTSAGAAEDAAVVRARQVEKLLTAVWCEVLSLLMVAPSDSTTLAAVGGSKGVSRAEANGLPASVRSAALAIAAGVLRLGHPQQPPPPRGDDWEGEEEAARHHVSLAHAAQQLWFAAAFLFLQQLSARNAHDITPWKQFAASCAAELKTRAAAAAALRLSAAAAAAEAKELKEGQGERGVGAPSLESQALAAWADGELGGSRVLAPELLKDTVERTRFRRAALLFKSFTPHMVSHAPGTTFLLIRAVDGFSTAWKTLMEEEVLPRQQGRLSRAAQQYFSGQQPQEQPPPSSSPLATAPPSDRVGSGRDDLYTCDDAAPPAAFTAGEKKLFALVSDYTARLAALLGTSSAHGFLLATVLGAVVCTRHIVPHPTRAPAAPPAVKAKPTGPGAAASAPAPTRVVGRGLTGRALGGALPTAATVTAAGTRAMAIDPAGPVPCLPPGVARDAVGNGHVRESFESAFQWLPRWSPFAPRSTLAKDEKAATPTDSDLEAQLLHFPPLGLLLKRLGIDLFLQPHLFHFCTQLKLGLGPAQHAEARERFAVASFLCGLCGPAVAFVMYHYATRPDLSSVQTDLTGEMLPESAEASAEKDRTRPGAALAAFTRAMNAYAAAADSELVFDVASASGAEGGGMGLLDSASGARLRRRGLRNGKAGAAAAAAAAAAREAEAEAMRVPVPKGGELRGTRFCVMVYPEVLPRWEDFLLSAAATGRGADACDSAQDAAASTTKLLVAPCRLALELLSGHYFDAAARLVQYLLSDERKVNVFLVPRTTMAAALSVNVLPAKAAASPPLALNVQSYLAEAATVCLSSQSSLPQRCSWLVSLLPMLRLASTYMAVQDFLVSLTEALGKLCQDALQAVDTSVEAVAMARKCLAVSELYLIFVIMPSLRVLHASPILYDRLDGLFSAIASGHEHWQVSYGAQEAECFHYAAWVHYLLPSSQLLPPSKIARATHDAHSGGRGDNNDDDDDAGGGGGGEGTMLPFDLADASVRQLFSAAGVMAPPQFPHDVLRCKEQEALFNQSLKRMNTHNVDYYRCLLKQVLCAEPIFVVDKLLTQAVGYENSFLPLHTRLLRGLPAPILTLAVHHGLATLRRFAGEEKVTDGGASMNRVSIVATFLATLWRQNIDAFSQAGGAGRMLVRAVEAALRSDARHDMVLGLELLKALLLQLAHRKLEHEEQFSDRQLKALVTPSVATKLFGRGAMESFRLARWSAWLTPADIAQGSATLARSLGAPCAVLMEKSSGSRDGSVTRNSDDLTVGQWILLHLCRLQARIYHLQADLDGPMDLVLLTSAKDFNTLNDLVFAVEELLPVGPPEGMLVQLAMTHVALTLSAKFRLKDLLRQQEAEKGAADRPAAVAALPSPTATLPDSGSAADEEKERPWAWLAKTLRGTLSYALLRQLSYFSAADFGFDEDAYEAAVAEWTACMLKADPYGCTASILTGGSPKPANGGVGGSALTAGARVGNGVKRPREADGDGKEDDEEEAQRLAEAAEKQKQERKKLLAVTDVDTARWLRTQRACMDAEKLAHRDAVIAHEGARDRLFRSLMEGVLLPAAPPPSSTEDHFSPEEVLTSFAVDYLLPRALLSMSDAIFVERLLTWLLRKTNSAKCRDDAERQRRTAAHRRVTDLMLTLVTAGVTFFTGLSDGECKRLGHLFAFVLRALDSTAAMPPLPPPLASAVEAILKAKQQEREAAASQGARDGAASLMGAGGGGVHGTSASSGASAAVIGVMCDEQQFHAYLRPATSPCLLSLLNGKQLRTDGGGGAGAAGDAELPPQESRGSAGKPAQLAAAAVSLSGGPAYPLQLEAYLCRFLVQYLGNKRDIPPHLHRNCFVLLERLDKNVFPSCLCSTELLLRVVALHAEKESRSYASALAVLKPMRESYKAKKAVLGPLNDIMASVAGGGHSSAAVGGASSIVPSSSPSSASSAVSAETLAATAKQWYDLWRTREMYMEQQLLREELAQFAHRQSFDAMEDEDEEKAQDEEEDSAAAVAEDEGSSSSDEEDESDRSASGSESGSQDSSLCDSDTDSKDEEVDGDGE